MNKTIACLFAVLVLGCAEAANNQVEISSYKELGAFFQKHGYTFDSWRAGLRAVPRAYVTDVPDRWTAVADQVSIQKKKEIFYSAILPIVLDANELIEADRRRAEPLAMRIIANSQISDEDRKFLIDLASRYRVNASSDVSADAAWVKELLLRVDIVPPSLALAQAAYESAYGTSRFAALGNALYGQWTFNGNGIDPLKKRAEMGSYQVAAFESPLASTLAYEFNLNTNKAYEKFRVQRAGFRHSGKLPDSAELALTLTAYSERGEAYAREIAHVIRSLRLMRADLAFLQKMEPIYIVPKKPS